MQRIAVCDDETVYIDTIKSYLVTYYENKRMKTPQIDGYVNPEKLLKAGHIYDLIFLDIQLSDTFPSGIDAVREIQAAESPPTGIDVARIIRSDGDYTPIVYITSHKNFMTHAFTVHAFAYLTKPLVPHEFFTVMDDYFTRLSAIAGSELEFRTRDGSYNLRPGEIVYFCLLSRSDILVKTKYGEEIVIKGMMKELITRLSPYNFFQANRSFIVNMHYVYKLLNEYTIVLTTNEHIEMSHNKKSEFRERLTVKISENIMSGGF
jgi:DNA-binding LytR/AlgR family response regulator